MHIDPGFPEVISVDPRLFKGLFRNLANNTEVHSSKGSSITLRLWTVGGVLYMEFVNKAGNNHQCCLALQSKHGTPARARVLNTHLRGAGGSIRV